MLPDGVYGGAEIPVIERITSLLKKLWFHDCRLCGSSHRRWFSDTIHLGTGDDIEKIKICRMCSDVLAKIKEKTNSLENYTPPVSGRDLN